MVLLENAKFLTELHKLYEGNKTQGSVWVTMKRSECERGTGSRAARFGSPPGRLQLFCARSCTHMAL